MSGNLKDSESGAPLWRVPEWFPEIPKDKLALLKVFHDELLKFNKSLNLISPKTILTADLIHFADAILASRIIASKLVPKSHIYDLGSGNGIPGVIFAILYPDFKVTALDSDANKSQFIKQAGYILKLSNLEVANQTIETIKEGSIQYAMTRGLGSITKCLLMVRKAFVSKGVFFHLKGERWATEIVEIPSQLCTVWKPDLVSEYKLPFGDITYSIVKTVRNV